MTDRYGEPDLFDDEPATDDEPEDDSHLSRLTPFARHHLDVARAALGGPEASR